MTQRIKTNIKFNKGLNNVKDKLYGFVTKVNGSWRGCRDTVEKKKIVFVDSSIADSIVPGALYCCSLMPMTNERQGFIVTSAKIVQFQAVLSTICRENVFLVTVKFGNRTIIYDPANKEQRKRDIQGIANNLRNRVDLVNAGEVAENFISSACIVKRLYQQSKI